MSIYNALLFFVLGVVLILKGGDWFVDAAAWIAKISGIPSVIVGATIVSLATTMPEITVSLIAALEGNTAIAVGNAVGSVTANMGIILSFCAIFNPFTLRSKDYVLKGSLMLASVSVLYIFCLGGTVPLQGSIILISIFVVFVYESIVSAKIKIQQSENKEKPYRKTIIVNALKFVAGITFIILGANLLVDNGIQLANVVGISEEIIGVTVIAIGTSLPELVTAISSIIKKQGALSVGNIIGSNIIDITIIVPLCNLASRKSLIIPQQSTLLDMPVCLLIAAFAVIPMLFRSKLMRWQGIIMFSLYVFYISIILKFFM